MKKRAHRDHKGDLQVRSQHVPIIGVLIVAAFAFAACSSGPAQSDSGRGGPRVLLVGSWRGRRGSYDNVQPAVDASRPGDWILVAPGDYHESPESQTGVHITTTGIHLRGLDRNAVIIDGSRPGAPSQCDGDAQWQNLQEHGAGRDGIVVDRVDNVSLENLTVCNFVGGGAGRQITFTGGIPNGDTRMGAFRGAYLTTTAVSSSERPFASYGIFITNTRGPGQISHSFASNMANSAFHIGACANCNTIFDNDTGGHSAIGLSAIDAGGRLVVTHSIFVDNSEGIDLASEEDESSPPPQDGACPRSQTGSVVQQRVSCTIVEHNTIRANNNPNVPGEGTVLQFVGAGVVVAGGRNDTIVDNEISGQGAYGIVVTVYPWTGPPGSPLAHCQGGQSFMANRLCLFDAYNNVVQPNRSFNNGTFRNPTNGDFAETTTANRLLFGPLGIEIACATRAFGSCEGSTQNAINALDLLAHAIHAPATELEAAGLARLAANYPTYTAATAPAPTNQPTMPNPCAGVPPNPWC
jgi:hypothetical protein